VPVPAAAAPVTTEDPVMKPSPRRRLTWLLAANVTVVLLVATLVSRVLVDSRQLHRQRALDAVDSLAASVASNVAAELSAVDLVLCQLRVAKERREAGEIENAAADLTRIVPTAERLRTLPVTALMPTLGQAWQSDPSDRLLVTGPRDAGAGRWVVDLARVSRAAEGAQRFAVVAEYDVAHFERLFAKLGLGGRSAVSLRMQDLSLVARHTDPPQARSGLGTRSTSRQLVEALAQAPLAGTYLAPTALDGIERANAYRRVEGVPMLVLVGLATVDYMMTWEREARSALALALLAVGVVVGASVFAQRAWRRDDDRRRTLDRERARLRGLLDTASDALHVLDRDGRLVEFGDAFAQLLGLTREQLADAQVMRWERAYPSSQVDKVLRSFAIGQRLAWPSVFERADGRRIDVAITATGVRIDERDLLILSARDVTASNRALRRLQANEALLERTGRIAGVGGWQADPVTGRLDLTSQAQRLLDLPPDVPATWRQALRRIDPTRRRVLLEAAVDTLRHGRSWDMELPTYDAHGPRTWLHVTGAPSAGADGASGIAGALRDVTERHQLQREQELRRQLQQQAATLTGMLRERDAMLDVLAHEVRQPLNNASAAMQGALASLRDIAEQAATPRLVRAQAVLGQVMARLDNTLAVAALLARQGPTQREDTDLDTLLAVTIADMPAAERERIVVQRDSAARTVSMDMGLMRLALRNLLSNALKYSRPGTTVTVRIGDSEEPLGLVIDVTDQGSGIEPGLRDHLFERGARGRHTPGAEHGLGLYIVRRVMELHGGEARLLATGEGGTTMRLLVAELVDD
jgi:PAS domain S-box-containing protein